MHAITSANSSLDKLRTNGIGVSRVGIIVEGIPYELLNQEKSQFCREKFRLMPEQLLVYH